MTIEYYKEEKTAKSKKVIRKVFKARPQAGT